MAVAGRYPELCTGLIAGGTGVSSYGATSALKIMGATYKIMSNYSLFNLVPLTVRITKQQISPENMKECFLRSGFNYDIWPDIAETMGFENYIESLKRYTGPVLFLLGEKDMRKDEQLFLKSTKNGKLVLIPNAQHLMVLDTRFIVEINKTILEFAANVFTILGKS